jgi:anti-sigma regulatory factor (Ser/Thr protein kinase)
MASIRPIQQPAATWGHRVTLRADPCAVPEARRQARAAVRYWHVPVDIEVVALLVSELVTNAVTHDCVPLPSGARGTVTLAIRGDEGQFRVDVHDGSPAPPVLRDSVPSSAECGRGLMLVDSLSTRWGSYPTATGKAVYFTLALEG